jgi:uncharacterized protein
MGAYIINDPVHGVMVFNQEEKKVIKQFIDTELFQRLRRIKQLGCGDLIFPGAVHTRFNHCLGVGYLAKRIYQRISYNIPSGEKIDKEKDKYSVMIAGLLHDVGHGPFSHAFEMLFDEKYRDAFAGKNEKIKKCKISHDDDWLRKFIEDLDFSGEVKRSDIVDILINKNKTYLSDIISSQFDVDRMDYLLRDSHFCGVPYGEIDSKWLMSSACLVQVGDKKRLGIMGKGIGAIEHYALARRLMTRNVYYHGKIKAAEHYVREFLKSLIDEIGDVQKSDDPILFQFLRKYNAYSNDAIAKIDTGEFSCKKKFIDSSYPLYKKLTDDDVWYFVKLYSEKNSESKCSTIANRLIKRELPHDYLLDASRINMTKSIIEEFKGGIDEEKHWMIHVDMLADFVSYKKDKGPLYVKENAFGRAVNHESEIFNLISDRSESTYYLYLDKHLNNYVDKTKIDAMLNKLQNNYCLNVPMCKS